MNRIQRNILSMACLVVTASLYAAQPILPQVAHSFGESIPQAGLLMAAAFLGNAVAQAGVLPLADCRERRGLAQALLGVCLAGNLLMACAPLAWAAAVGSALVGIGACSNMLILSYATELAEDTEKGRTSSVIMGGVLAGILCSRIASGGLATLVPWRMVYLAFALFLLVVFLILFAFPRAHRHGAKGTPYRRLLASIVSMTREDRDLRRRMALGMGGFFVFNVLWTGLTFLLAAEPFRFDSLAIGLFGLAGAAGIAASRRAGKLFDRGLGESLIQGAWVVLAASWLVLVLGAELAFVSLAWGVLVLICGVVALDAGMQAQHVTNQSALLTTHASSGSRALTAYMACNLLAGTLANVLVSVLYPGLQWLGMSLLCLLVCVFMLLSIRMRTRGRGRARGR